jgi:hypothetical protein
MPFYKLLLLLAMCVAGCAPHFKYSNLYDRSTVTEIEHTYQRLFDAENEVKPADVERLLDNLRFLRQGNEQYHPPGLLSICFDLRYMINHSLAGEKDEILMRRYLIWKTGVVSSLVAVSRSADVQLYLSPRDRYAFTLEEIRAICGRRPPKYSSLAIMLMQNEKLSGPE